ncbi:probable serine incorporator [Fagus crenata]
MRVSTGAVEGAEVNIRPRNSEIVSQEEVSGSLEQKNLVDYSAERKKSLRARYSYGIIFLVTNLIAWFIRDYGQRLLPQLHYLKACGPGGHDCFRTLGVLRVSLGCFIFFFLMFLSTSNTKKLFEARNTWHSRWWSFKFFLFVVSVAIPFFLSSDFIQLYGEFARIGAGIFLLLQLVSVIQFINWWNNYWMPDKEMKQSCSIGLFMSTLFYIASICGIVVMYPFYVPRASCTLNIFFITWTAILLIVMMVISLHSKVNRGLLSSGIMASYVVFLCWSAIRSEPATQKCNTQEQVNGNGDWITILSFLMAICAIVMATFSTGIDSQSFQFRKDGVQQEDDIPYKYGFFHLVFSLGAMYFAMLFISWNLNSSARKTIRWSIDVGWASTWVKIVNEWFAATIYLWTLISPVVIQSKVMDHDEPMQQTDDSAMP